MKYLYVLLVLVPIGIYMEVAGVGGDTALFVVSALALVPLAALLGSATESVATYTGPKIGGLLNATLGNAAELIITIVALREGLFGVVKASISGSIIGNILLVLGAAVLFGGIKNGTQKFDAGTAGVNASIMALAVMAMMIPAIFAIGNSEHHPSEANIVDLSDGTAIVLIVLYGLYLLYTVFSSDSGGKSSVTSHAEEPDEEEASMKLPLALGILAGSTIAIVVMSEVLVGVIEPTAEAWGLSELFVGVMLVPLVGNVAEHLVAVQMAAKNKMDLSLGIAVGSAVQIALFVAPVLVLVSQFVGPEPITLVFNQFELVALFASVIITVMISIDGRSNWLEGVQLISLYTIIGLAFYFIP